MIPTLRTVTVTRYIAPLREGGSLPALAEEDDDFKNGFRKEVVFFISLKKKMMKHFCLFISLLLLGCNSKEEQPELDYVNISLFPSLLMPSDITVNFASRTVIFNHRSECFSLKNNCDEDIIINYEKMRGNEFVFFKMNKEEFLQVSTLFNSSFANSVKKNNQKMISQGDSYYASEDGFYFEFNIVENNFIFSTNNLLALSREDEIKINSLLKIISNHSKETQTKSYIDKLSFYLK